MTEPEPLVEAVNRLGDLISEEIEIKRAEADARRREQSQTDVESYMRRRSDDRPHPFSFLTFARAVPGLIEQFGVMVPGEFWNEDELDGARVAVVACPCGGEPPVVPFNSVLGCACERIFAFTGRNVRVANGPTGTPEAAVVD